MREVYYVGLDVHKDSIQMAVRDVIRCRGGPEGKPAGDETAAAEVSVEEGGER
jgi:hypothetical protein